MDTLHQLYFCFMFSCQAHLCVWTDEEIKLLGECNTIPLRIVAIFSNKEEDHCMKLKKLVNFNRKYDHKFVGAKFVFGLSVLNCHSIISQLIKKERKKERKKDAWQLGKALVVQH